MKILDLLGFAMRPLRSDQSKLIESQPVISSQPHTIILNSPVFGDGAAIPKSNTVDGQGLFPDLMWSDIPSGSQSLVLVIEDPDAPKLEPFVHGIIYNIPADWRALSGSAANAFGLSPDSVAHGLEMGTNSMSKAAYMAPAPPPGHGVHHYHFQLIAIDAKLLFPNTPTLADIKEALTDHVLASGELVGIYER
jgi:hypothetical protein